MHTCVHTRVYVCVHVCAYLRSQQPWKLNNMAYDVKVHFHITLEMIERLQEEGRKKKQHSSIPTCPQELGRRLANPRAEATAS